jgi:predicted outer membrane repeat protein
MASIEKCSFTEVYANNAGGAIYSTQGNNLTVIESIFN